jgi:hypothetical protein
VPFIVVDDLRPELGSHRHAAIKSPDIDREGVTFFLAVAFIKPDRPWKRAAFSQYPRSSGGRRLMGYSMRTDRCRFTIRVDRDDHSKVEAVELRGHETDPQENVNVAKAPANAAVVDMQMNRWRSGWQAARPGPLPKG